MLRLARLAMLASGLGISALLSLHHAVAQSVPVVEDGHSARPLWVLLVQRGPDNEDQIATASFYTKEACENALNFLRNQQEHPNREFRAACMPSGAV
ncbi:hypothetical protein HK13_09020 [Acetobacter indonesiensis]|uniref:hypothetical protein n=1 Tax=Acetobacter indonesiensis TaxID=104101 RepID=UPI000A3B1E23|nr:hypothetical protein [Acetobacter indonesiensis]OUI92744.1 hypothetical protein HK13_09020 [Acetobacter indonesiensis]